MLLPDGRKQTVRYYADENGYFPVVTYEQVSIGNTLDPNLIFNPERNILREHRSGNEYSSPEVINQNEMNRPGYDFTTFKSVFPLDNDVSISTSNFDFHKNRKIDFVGNDVNTNKNSNSFSNLPTKLPVAFTKFTLNKLNTNNKRLNINQEDSNSFTKPSLKDSLESDFNGFVKPVKSIDTPREATYNPTLEISNAAYKEGNLFVNQLKHELITIKESEEKHNENKMLNPADLFTTVYIPNNKNSVSGYFKPFTNDIKFANLFSRKFSSPMFKEINTDDNTGSHEKGPEDSVVPAFVPVPYPVEDVERSKENSTQYDDETDEVNSNNLSDYWDEDYL